MPGAYQNCTEVTPQCPVSATTYGYYPNLGVNALYLAIFSFLLLLNVVYVLRYRLWTYAFAVSASCLLELLGYVGRVAMHYNPWSDWGFRIQVICLIIGPSFLAAGIYLTLKHLILYFGPEYSRLKPRLYTWLFVGCDVFSIVVQALGAGVATSSSGDKASTASKGNDIIIAGIAFQVGTMVLCGVLALDYTIRSAKGTKGERTTGLTRMGRPQIFCITSALAYLFVLVRCIYRLPEMAAGWGGELMRDETEFLVLDGL